MRRIYKLLLSPSGRIGRGEFIAGLALLILFVMAQKLLFPYLGQGYMGFFVPMFLFFFTFHITLCVFGKRLHDLGRSLWPFTGLIFLMIIIAIIVALKFGGLEYFNTVIENPEYANDPQAMQKVRDIYEAKLEQSLPQVRIIMLIAPILFSLWLAFAKGQKKNNRYGKKP